MIVKDDELRMLSVQGVQQLPSFVCRVIIENNDFQIRIPLVQQRGDTCGDGSGFIARGNQYTDSRQSHGRRNRSMTREAQEAEIQHKLNAEQRKQRERDEMR